MAKYGFKTYWAIIGMVVSVCYLTYYFIDPFNFFYFMLGFGLIYLGFVIPVKKMK